MAEETQATAREQQPSSTMPHTWQKALEMWDASEPVDAELKCRDSLALNEVEG